MYFNKKSFIYSIISALIVLALIGFVIYPLLKGIKEDSKNLAFLKGNLLLFQNRSADIEKVKADYERYKADLERVDSSLVDPNLPIELIKYWEKSAAGSGVSIDISPISLKASKADPWDSIAFQLIVTGSFPDFLSFLQKIENSRYLIEINNLSAKRLSSKELQSTKYKDLSSGDASVSLTVKVFTK